MLGRILKKNNYFEMVNGAECKALSNTNYYKNYNEIFENNDLELDRQIPSINKLNT